ncbi:MAG: DNA polymerase III subunit gamma/tau [Prevotellaceae bacterium]|jgi:DNA polymerase-3 subunit gamma/tau|nr:DNA polymerase III subunit gamma/tau [Prevotellaceae bacterium]
MEQFIVSARKYRPLTFASVVGQSAIAQTLKNAIERKQLAHAYLFCGPRGVGKTTCARIFAKTINCFNPDENGDACGKCESCKAFAENRSYNIHELDAASNNSVEDIRNLIDQVRVPPQIGKYSVYIIDEVHMLSTAAFNAFLKTLEEPPVHAVFILATTEKHKIIPTILSRCQIYDFNRIGIEDAVTYIEKIAGNENIDYESEALHIIAQKADGSMRDALSIFDQVVSFCGTNVTYAKVIENLNVLDYEYYFNLTNAFISGDYCSALVIFDEILAKGFDAQYFIRGLNSHFRDLLVCKDTRTVSLLEVGATIAESYKKQAETCSVNFLFTALDITNACDVGYKTSSNQRLHIELALCKLSNITVTRKTEERQPVKIVENIETNKKETNIGQIIEQTNTGDIEEKPENNIKFDEIKDKTTVAVRHETVSIKGFSSLTESINNEHKNTKQEENDTLQMTEDFTEEQLLTAWKNCAEIFMKKNTRFASAMIAAKPVREAGNLIVFNVQQIVQKNALEEKGIAKNICLYLQKELKNTSVKLEVRVDQSGDKINVPKLYTDIDKEKYMREKNPEFANFQAAFELYDAK